VDTPCNKNSYWIIFLMKFRDLWYYDFLSSHAHNELAL
jgi:hypothetical protein